MALRYYALNKGQQQESVTEAAAAQTKSVEIAVESTLERSEAMRMIEAIKCVVMQDTWPPV